MTQEEKQLLFKDLCARLPYSVVVHCTDSDTDYNCFLTTDILHEIQNGYEYYDYKPYLRPMSSMTEEEKEELCRLCDFEKSYDDGDYFTHYGIEVISEYCVNGKKTPESFINYSVIDFFYEHYLDWRGLIERGLSLEAPKDMYIF